MKLIIFILCVVFTTVLSFTDEQVNKVVRLSRQCRAESGISLEDINSMKGSTPETASKKLKTHLLCFHKKTGLMKASGKIDKEQVKKMLRRVENNEAKVEEILGDCAVDKSTPEDTAFEFFTCIKKNSPTFSPV